MATRDEVFVHLVWATAGRRPSLGGEIERVVHDAIRAKCAGLHCVPCTIGGTEDHVHVLARLHPSVPIARLAGAAKGASSHAANLRFGESAGSSRFRWQRGYGAFAVPPSDVPDVERYVLDQPRRHLHRATDPTLEPDDNP